MKVHATKSQQVQHQSVSPTGSEKKGGEESSLQLKEHGPDGAQHSDLQNLANSSPQMRAAAQLQVFVNQSEMVVQEKETAQEKEKLMSGDESMQMMFASGSPIPPDDPIIQKKENSTGLPDNLKSGVESLSGFSMDDVKVHTNSDQPAQFNAHAYAQGTDIHLASGQEKHLPHEAWHVVQQKQGRVKPTKQLKGKFNVNDDTGLEKEADVMGAKALQMKRNIAPFSKQLHKISTSDTVQREVDESSDFDAEDINAIDQTADERRMAQAKKEYLLAQKIKAGGMVPSDVNTAATYDYILTEQAEKAATMDEEGMKMDARDVIRQVDYWLASEAKNAGQEAMVTPPSPYSKLSIDQKTRVFKAVGVDVKADDPESYKKLRKRQRIFKGINWSGFALAVRAESGNAEMHDLLSGANPGSGNDSAGAAPYANTKKDVVETGTGGTMATAGIGAAALNTGIRLAGAAEVASYQTALASLGAGGDALGVIFSVNNILTTAEASGDHKVTEQVLSDGVRVLSELANIAHSAAKLYVEISLLASGKGALAQVGYNEATKEAALAGLNGVAMTAVAITAIIKGSLDIVQGGYAFVDAILIRSNLQKLEQQLTNTDFKLACKRAEETQRVRRNMGAATAAAGAAMLAGGVILTTVALTNPIGWILLGVAGGISLVAALYKMRSKGKANKKFTIEAYKMQLPPSERSEDPTDDALGAWLNELGFVKGDYKGFHDEFMQGLANGIHDAIFNDRGVRSEEAKQLISTLRLKINEKKKTPTVNTIAKRLRNP